MSTIAATPIDAAECRVAVAILAQTDALWIPTRHGLTEPAAIVNVSQLRRLYGSLGCRWHAADTSETGRKQSQRQLESLAERGLIEVTRNKARTVYVRLSDDTEEEMRVLCGLPGIDAGLASVAEVIRLGGFVRETALAGHGYGDMPPGELVLVEELALPALTRGWLRSNSDAEGRVCYWATEAGAVAVEGWRPVGEPLDAPPVDENLRRQYYHDVQEALARFAALPPSGRGDIGEIPLQASALAVADHNGPPPREWVLSPNFLRPTDAWPPREQAANLVG